MNLKRRIAISELHTNLKKNVKPVALYVNTSGLNRELLSKLSNKKAVKNKNKKIQNYNISGIEP